MTKGGIRRDISISNVNHCGEQKPDESMSADMSHLDIVRSVDDHSRAVASSNSVARSVLYETSMKFCIQILAYMVFKFNKILQ